MTSENSWQIAASGALAGFVSRLTIAPIDVVKIRLQLQTNRLSLRGASVSENQKYRGLLHAFRLIYKEEGLLAFWKGNLSAQVLYVTYGGVQFATFDAANTFMKKLKMHDRSSSFISGALAGSVATTCTYPFDLLRTRFVSQGNERVLQSLNHAVFKIYKEEGLRGFYRGLWPSLLQIAPYMGIMFSVYNSTFLLFNGINSNNKAINASLAGAAAGFVSKLVVMPFDVVRKRLQVQGPHLKHWVVATNAINPRSGFITCCQQIICQEGMLALWRGTSLAILKSIPNSAITFGVYELGKQAFKKYSY